MEFIFNNFNVIAVYILLIILVIISYKLIDKFDIYLNNMLNRNQHDSLFSRFLPLLNKTLKTLILFFVIITVCQTHGIPVNSIIAGLGVGGLAIGFAAKESISNIFGSISLIADRVFKIGDYVVINQSINNKDVEGIIEDINFRSTKIRSFDDSLIVIPNNITANSTIINNSYRKKRPIREIISLTYNVSDEQINIAIKIIKDILKNNESIIENDNIVELDSLGEYSVNILLLTYTSKTSFNSYQEVKAEVLSEIYAKFNQNNLDFAYPTQDIILKNS